MLNLITGTFIYWDAPNSTEFNPKKKLKGIAVVEDDYHAFLVIPKDIKEVDWWDGKHKCEEQFAQMPNLRQCQAIYDNKEVLNQSLAAAGFTSIDDEVVWSSTEDSSNRAWLFSMDNGYRYYHNKYYNNSYVRPVLAL